MAQQDPDSIPALVRSLLDDTRELIREELLLARTEIRDEMSAVQTAGMMFGAAAVSALLGVAILAIGIGGAIADGLDWPPWSGHAIVAALLLGAEYVAARLGRARLATIRALPKNTQSMKENLAWIQSKSNDK